MKCATQQCNVLKMLIIYIMHDEATELLAFVGTDSKRIPIPGIPYHLHIAYALKGNSL